MNFARKLLHSSVAFVLFAWVLQTHAAQKLRDQDCLACHGDPALTEEINGKAISIFIDKSKLSHSVHGAAFTCVDCHKDVTSLAHEKRPRRISCGACHAEALGAWAHSTHARLTKTGKSPAATCVDCHGDAHGIVAPDDSQSPVAHANIPATCGRCHGQRFLMESNGQSAQPFYSYQDSVHGRAVKGGSQKAAVCTDCHAAHAILPPTQPHSPIYRLNVPATCGKCHGDVTRAYTQSIHGQALARGNPLAPVCTDCHGIHSIKSPANPASPIAKGNLSRDVCAPCHQGVRLSQEFGVPGNRVTSYFDSYHGLAAEGGSVIAANCASCHGVHDILPSSDPRSKINAAHLEATCGQCHKGITPRFTQTKVHLQDGVRGSDIGSIAVRWVRWIYTGLIILVIGSMFLHNFFAWRRKAIERRRNQNPTMLRMSLQQRWQHLVLLTSFIVLVLTGFALKFPDTWFAHTLGMGENLRGTIHRIAGVVLIAAGIYHLFYLAAAREGRRLIRDLAPVSQDAFDIWTALRYYLGFSQEKPRFGRFSYGEKAEYWALVWGTGLMGLTGIMIWAKVWVGNILARWWVDVATAVHYYEAILATLAIVVWHFYQVIFDPDVYPMNWAWYDGKMSVEHYRREHPLDADPEEEAGDG